MLFTSCNMLFKEFLNFFRRYFANALLFVDANHRSLFAHALAFHFFNDYFLFEFIFLHKVMQAIFNFLVVFTTFLTITEVNYFFRFFRLAHRLKNE